MAIRKAAAAMAASVAGLWAWLGAAWADQPREWQLNLQESASPLMDRIHSFHTLLLYIIFGVSAFVLALLVWVIVRYNARANPTPSRTTHNTLIEVVWTVVPILILVVIAVPSFRLLYYADKAPNEAEVVVDGKKERVPVVATLTIKARGHQWYWSYIYESAYKTNAEGKPVDEQDRVIDLKATPRPFVDLLKDANFVFESRIACRGSSDEADKKSCADFERDHGRKPVRLLDVDNAVVIPVGEYVRVHVQGMDVIHSWTIPAMGAKVDANPGRINELWIYAKKPGIYYGQCSELCGKDHGFMPIAVRAVSRADFEKWLEEAKTKFEKIAEPKRAEVPARR
jgi:cytochrome c oxidase subunit 2